MEIRANDGVTGSYGLRRRVRWVVAVYAADSIAWIALSDRLLGLLVRDTDTLVRVSVFKGVGFVGVTSAVLYVLLRW
ncbi:MAG: hypothetical protein JNG84_04495, partial [Archangium sp.]|nr:hypothetical protein [Archangium sp.]